ncbi:MAG: hypothetical protein LBJ74_01380 [Heliobacteriaceae bacterium]|jgi:hypothetical protein|nr:hypothetical protein [Heliobacteriaceae bacterium]
MLEGAYAEAVFMHERVRPIPIMPQETSGLTLGTESFFRYSNKDSDYPTLTIAEPLYDGHGDVIAPGHYELALSDMRDYLILLQSKRPRAIIPVFKLEEDAKEKERLNDKDYKKELKREAKAREKTNKKRAKAGQPPDEPQVYMEAVMQYVRDGDYYLLKYEHGTLKAWGAFKG